MNSTFDLPSMPVSRLSLMQAASNSIIPAELFVVGNRTPFVHNGELRLMTLSGPSDFNIHVVGRCANADRKTYSITLQHWQLTSPMVLAAYRG